MNSTQYFHSSEVELNFKIDHSHNFINPCTTISRLQEGSFIVVMGKQRQQKNKRVKTDDAKRNTVGGKQKNNNNPQVHAPQSTFPPNLLSKQYFSSTKGKKSSSSKKLQLKTLVPSAVFVADNFLSQNECNAWVQCAEEIGFEKLNSPQTKLYAQRECGRISRNDWKMADSLYQRMKSIVDEISRQVDVPNIDNKYRPVTCNGNLRLYKYEKNMSFGRHFDGSQRIELYENGNTEITVLVYLTSCKGGATRFYLPNSKGGGSGGRKKKEATGSADGVAFVPTAGSILMHMHGDRCLEHEADPVLDGVKYVLRTDIVYATNDIPSS